MRSTCRRRRRRSSSRSASTRSSRLRRRATRASARTAGRRARSPRGGRWVARDRRSAGHARLERAEEAQQLALLVVLELPVALRGSRRLAAVAEDRGLDADRGAVVHEARAQPQSPERRGAQLARAALATVLDDPVAGADVVQQEVTV